jgi:GDP-4-dehydro-6-deoxy-D-mannose reductase
MNRVYVTGATGFVGPHLRAHVRERGFIDVTPHVRVEVTDLEALRASLRSTQPTVIVHLAARSSVAASWGDPVANTRANVVGTLQILEAARLEVPTATVVLVSSSEVYGLQERDALPITEHYRLAPQSPYAASKAEAEHAALEACLEHGQRVIIARPFTHTGPGQSEQFFVPAITKRLFESRVGGHETVAVGNLTARRDLSDVRDVVRAYLLLAQFGAAGEIYNVASGHDVGLDEVAETLRAHVAPHVHFVEDVALMRPQDVPVTRGNWDKLHNVTGWEPTISLSHTLRDVVQYWSQQFPAVSIGNPL